MESAVFLIIDDPINGFLLSKKIKIIDQAIITLHLKEPEKSFTFLEETDAYGFPNLILFSLDILGSDYLDELRQYENLIASRKAETTIIALSSDKEKIELLKNESYLCPVIPIPKPLETSKLISICYRYADSCEPNKVHLPKGL